MTAEDLIAALARTLPASVKRAGEQLVGRGRVSDVTEPAPGRVVGSVHDGRPHVVAIELTEDEVVGQCSCGERRRTCAHVWALLLTVQARQPEPPREERWVNHLRGLERAVQAAPPRPFGPTWTADMQLLYVLEPRAAMRGPELRVWWGHRRRTPEGWSRLARRVFEVDALPAALDPVDREALRVIEGLSADPRAKALPHEARIPAGLASLTLPVLCATGRCVLAGTEGRDEPAGLVWDAEAPWQLALSTDEADDTVVVAPVLVRGDEQRALGRDAVSLVGDLVVCGERVVRVEGRGTKSWLEHHAEHGPLVVPARQLPAALARLSRLPACPPLARPGIAGFSERRGAPAPVLVLDASSGISDGHLLARVFFQYGPARVPAAESGPHTVLTESREVVFRDAAAEASRQAELVAAGAKLSGADLAVAIPASAFAQLATTLITEGWVVEAAGRPVRGLGRISVSIRTDLDWFDLVGEAEFDDQALELPAVLEAVRRGKPVVTLGDGSTGVLPAVWLARLATLASCSSGGRFRRAQAGLLDALLEGVPVEADEGFRAARAALASFDGVAARPAPASFRGTLRGYQEEGLGWMEFLDRFGFGGCLADDMGLGKTVQVLAHLAHVKAARRKRSTSLVVVPRSLLFNWQDEAARFTPGVSVHVHHGTERSHDARKLLRHDLVLTTYGTLLRDVEWLESLPFDHLVIDEAQLVKNPSTATAQALRRLQSRRRLALTGTPVENHLDELAAQMNFLNPGLFGADRSPFPADTERLDPRLAAAIRAVLRPFLLRRTKAAVATQLPGRTEQTVKFELEPAQRAVYDDLRDHYRAHLLSGAPPPPGQERMQVLEALLRLRQVACHPALVDPDLRDTPSAKLDLLVAALTDLLAEGHKVLVFSQFTKLLAIVSERLSAEGFRHEYLDGATRNRGAVVARFQTDPDVRVFLISLKAGGVGLNLTAADYVFILDPWWNPAVEAQAIDRSHRIGQTRPVVAYRLVARDTVEERILELQAKKRDLADAILAEDSGPIANLTRDDLAHLLG